jgi:hypothetical protein
MGSTNELDTSQEELIEDDDFFLWEPTQEGAMCSNEVPKILCTVMDAGSALSLNRSKVYQLMSAGAGTRRAIGQRLESAVSVAGEPTVQRPSIDSVLRGDLDDRRAGIECFAHR